MASRNRESMAAEPQAMKDVDDIRSCLGGYRSWMSEGTYDTLLLLVHPGYFREREWFKVGSDDYDVNGLEYGKYAGELFEEVGSWLEDGDPVVVLYPESMEDGLTEFM
ncbi:MAG: hypothetical protein ABEI07_00315, partial [Candidatus Nanohaloarchaea archaeon]